MTMNIYLIIYIRVCVCDYIYTYLWWDIPGSSCLTFSLLYQTGNVQGSSPAACSAGEVVTRSWSPWQKWSVLVSFGWSQNWLKWQIWNPGNPCTMVYMVLFAFFWCTMVVSWCFLLVCRSSHPIEGLDISHRGTSHRKDPKPLWVAWQQGLYPMNCQVGNPG